MKLIINASIMITGVVVIDFENESDGKATILTVRDFQFTTCQSIAGPGDTEERLRQGAEDPDLKNAAVLRLVATTHHDLQAELEERVQIVTVQETEKGRAN